MPTKILLLACSVWMVFAGRETNAQSDTSIEVKLVDAGSAPRKVIRLKPTKGFAQTTLMSMKMSQSMTVAGQKIPPVSVPTMEFTIDIAVNQVDTNGDVSFEYTYSKADVVDDPKNPSPASGAMRSMLKTMEGLHGTGICTDRAFTKESKMELPDSVPDPMRSAMESMQESIGRSSTPFPEEAIGVGGKWTVTQAINSNGMEVNQTTTHTIKSVQGDRYEIEVELLQSANPQVVKTPGAPPGMVVKLKSLESSGKGTMQLDSKSIFPTSLISIESKSDIETTIAGQKQAMQSNMVMEMSLTPAPTISNK